MIHPSISRQGSHSKSVVLWYFFCSAAIGVMSNGVSLLCSLDQGAMILII